jgi:hypothetical protein
MRQVAMTIFSLQDAAEQTGTSKIDIWRAIQAGTLSAKRTDDGGFAIDRADLFAVFETKQADQHTMAADAVASVEASESPEANAMPEAAATNDIAVAFALLGTELKGLLERPTEAPPSDEPRQNSDERQVVDPAELTAQLAEPGSERAKVEKMAEHAARADHHNRPWWRRLVG